MMLALELTAAALLLLTFLSLYRAAVGPTVADRVVAVNVVSTKTVAVIAVVSYLADARFFLDVALVYALIGFLTTVGVANYVERGKVW